MGSEIKARGDGTLESTQGGAALTSADLREHGGVLVISHHALAERLGVEPHDLVKVMRRLAEEDTSFGAFEVLGSFSENTAESGGRPKTHYLLDEHRAITVTLESRSKRRHALRKQIVDVYLAVKKNGPELGLLRELPALIAAMAAMNDTVGALVQTVHRQFGELSSRVGFVERHISTAGRITRDEYSALKRDIGRVVLLECLAGNKGHKNQAGAHRSIQNDLGQACGWGGYQQPWNELPRDQLPVARLVLRRREADVEKLASARQLSLSLPRIGGARR